MKTIEEKKLVFTVNFPELRRELINNNHQNWIFAQPINIMTNILALIAQRSAEINDKELIRLCAMLSLYSFSDPSNVDYDEKRRQEIIYGK